MSGAVLWLADVKWAFFRNQRLNDLVSVSLFFVLLGVIEFVSHFNLFHILGDHLRERSLSLVEPFLHVNSFFVFVEGYVPQLAKFRKSYQLLVARLNPYGVGRHADLLLGFVVLIALCKTEGLQQDVGSLDKGRTGLLFNIKVTICTFFTSPHHRLRLCQVGFLNWVPNLLIFAFKVTRVDIGVNLQTLNRLDRVLMSKFFLNLLSLSRKAFFGFLYSSISRQRWKIFVWIFLWELSLSCFFLAKGVHNVAVWDYNLRLRAFKVSLKRLYFTLIVKERDVVLSFDRLDDLDVATTLLGLDLCVWNCDPLLEFSLILNFSHLGQSFRLRLLRHFFLFQNRFVFVLRTLGSPLSIFVVTFPLARILLASWT